MNAETIRRLIEQGLPGARAQVQGEDGVHFEATVVSPDFAGNLPRNCSLTTVASKCTPSSPATCAVAPGRPCSIRRRMVSAFMRGVSCKLRTPV